MENTMYVDESWRTPDEQEILDNFYSSVWRGTQWQVWNRTTLRGTFLSREQAENSAQEIWKEAGGTYKNSRWSDHSSGESYEIDYSNLELQDETTKRWMTTPTFILEVRTGKQVLHLS